MTEKQNSREQASKEEHLDDRDESRAPVVVTGSQAVLQRPDARAKKDGMCGDTIEFFLSLDGDRIADVGFKVVGCKNTLACAQATAVLVKGRNLAEAGSLAAPKWIAEMLEGLPEDSKHCLVHASETMKQALDNAVVRTRDPWRKLYRKTF
jgi:nitrogen fixation NifU-like protein